MADVNLPKPYKGTGETTDNITLYTENYDDKQYRGDLH